MAQNFEIMIDGGDVILEGLHFDTVYENAISSLYTHAKHFIDSADYDYPDGEYDFDNAVTQYAEDNIWDFLHLLPGLCKTTITYHSNN